MMRPLEWALQQYDEEMVDFLASREMFDFDSRVHNRAGLPGHRSLPGFASCQELSSALDPVLHSWAVRALSSAE